MHIVIFFLQVLSRKNIFGLKCILLFFSASFISEKYFWLEMHIVIFFCKFYLGKIFLTWNAYCYFFLQVLFRKNIFDLKCILLFFPASFISEKYFWFEMHIVIFSCKFYLRKVFLTWNAYCYFFPQVLSWTFLHPGRIRQDTIICVLRSFCKMPRFFSDINQSGFSQQISVNVRIIRLRENMSSGSRVSQSGQTDRRTEMTKLIVAFRNSANSPKE